LGTSGVLKYTISAPTPEAATAVNATISNSTTLTQAFASIQTAVKLQTPFANAVVTTNATVAATASPPAAAPPPPAQVAVPPTSAALPANFVNFTSPSTLDFFEFVRAMDYAGGMSARTFIKEIQTSGGNVSKSFDLRLTVYDNNGASSTARHYAKTFTQSTIASALMNEDVVFKSNAAYAFSLRDSDERTLGCLVSVCSVGSVYCNSTTDASQFYTFKVPYALQTPFWKQGVRVPDAITVSPAAFPASYNMLQVVTAANSVVCNYVNIPAGGTQIVGGVTLSALGWYDASFAPVNATKCVLETSATNYVVYAKYVNASGTMFGYSATPSYSGTLTASVTLSASPIHYTSSMNVNALITSIVAPSRGMSRTTYARVKVQGIVVYAANVTRDGLVTALYDNTFFSVPSSLALTSTGADSNIETAVCWDEFCANANDVMQSARFAVPYTLTFPTGSAVVNVWTFSQSMIGNDPFTEIVSVSILNAATPLGYYIYNPSNATFYPTSYPSGIKYVSGLYTPSGILFNGAFFPDKTYVVATNVRLGNATTPSNIVASGGVKMYTGPFVLPPSNATPTALPANYVAFAAPKTVDYTMFTASLSVIPISSLISDIQSTFYFDTISHAFELRMVIKNNTLNDTVTPTYSKSFYDNITKSTFLNSGLTWNVSDFVTLTNDTKSAYSCEVSVCLPGHAYCNMTGDVRAVFAFAPPPPGLPTGFVTFANTASIDFFKFTSGAFPLSSIIQNVQTNGATGKVLMPFFVHIDILGGVSSITLSIASDATVASITSTILHWDATSAQASMPMLPDSATGYGIKVSVCYEGGLLMCKNAHDIVQVFTFAVPYTLKLPLWDLSTTKNFSVADIMTIRDDAIEPGTMLTVSSHMSGSLNRQHVFTYVVVGADYVLIQGKNISASGFYNSTFGALNVDNIRFLSDGLPLHEITLRKYDAQGVVSNFGIPSYSDALDVPVDFEYNKNVPYQPTMNVMTFVKEIVWWQTIPLRSITIKISRIGMSSNALYLATSPRGGTPSNIYLERNFSFTPYVDGAPVPFSFSGHGNDVEVVVCSTPACDDIHDVKCTFGIEVPYTLNFPYANYTTFEEVMTINTGILGVLAYNNIISIGSLDRKSKVVTPLYYYIYNPNNVTVFFGDFDERPTFLTGLRTPGNVLVTSPLLTPGQWYVVTTSMYINDTSTSTSLAMKPTVGQRMFTGTLVKPTSPIPALPANFVSFHTDTIDFFSTPLRACTFISSFLHPIIPSAFVFKTTLLFDPFTEITSQVANATNATEFLEPVITTFPTPWKLAKSQNDVMVDVCALSTCLDDANDKYQTFTLQVPYTLHFPNATLMQTMSQVITTSFASSQSFNALQILAGANVVYTFRNSASSWYHNTSSVVATGKPSFAANAQYSIRAANVNATDGTWMQFGTLTSYTGVLVVV
jgi:hypothetical protein